MAIGDDATSAGFPLVPDTGEEGRKRWGAREINRTRDLIALVKNLIPTGKPANRSASGITYGTGLPTGGDDGDIHHRIFGGVTFTFVKHNGEWIQSTTGGGGGGEGGVTDHSLLTGRNSPDQHTIPSITALQGALDSKVSTTDPRLDQIGVTSHPELDDRNVDNQHTITSITGLSDALSGPPSNHGNEAHSENFVTGTGVNAMVAVTEAAYPASPVTGVLYVVF